MIKRRMFRKLSAYVDRTHGPAAALHGRRHGFTVQFRPVTVADSDGRAVRIGSGLEEGEHVILNPGWGITDNEKVQVVMCGEAGSAC